ncbi:MAG TPA: lipoate-protein ligase B [Alphaproteobacteria bacterium]|jgi:lipoyl(octanoyl) transferase|nr:lipoate-protein ligase B [Alphaproteobacteria bacterium]|tara:strand:- start:605 stop:1246 length:642 start_codon:yes stop_codon:yes gene_type:complete
MPAPVFRTLEGLAPYEETVTAMAAHAAAIRNGGAGEEVWLLEHHSVLTGGTSSRPEDLVNPGGIPVHQTGRGGQWTWHGPGQRVAYVMLDLQRRNPDVRAYVHALEGWIIDVLASFGIDGRRRDGHPGIWVDGDGRMDKVAAIGVRISRWVTWHGIAVNLDPSMDGFGAIIPCGVRDGGVTSLRRLGLDIDMATLDAALTDSFAAHFPEPRDG